MGDVALCSPVISAVLEQHSDVEITFLTRTFFQPLFSPHPRLNFKNVELKTQHKGIFGLRKLFNELKTEGFDTVIDLHDVLRSKIIRRFFGFSIYHNAKVYTIDKGRKEKEAIVYKKHPLTPLKHTTQRYLDVFSKAGLITQLNKEFYLEPIISNNSHLNLTEFTTKYIVLAPFAAHKSKEWGEQKWMKFLELYYRSILSETHSIYFIGGGENEKKQLDSWSKQYPRATNITGKYSLIEELFVLSHAAVVIAMDSANMHLADLVGTKVISIWGATHPYLGFSPIHNEALIIQTEIPCRPCSVYGSIKTNEQKKCTHQAMEAIREEDVLEKLASVISD
jgi:ADP-heptose:LPS heptosyltransferase